MRYNGALERTSRYGRISTYENYLGQRELPTRKPTPTFESPE